jgi:hypothetical protein
VIYYTFCDTNFYENFVDQKGCNLRNSTSDGQPIIILIQAFNLRRSGQRSADPEARRPGLRSADPEVRQSASSPLSVTRAPPSLLDVQGCQRGGLLQQMQRLWEVCHRECWRIQEVAPPSPPCGEVCVVPPLPLLCARDGLVCFKFLPEFEWYLVAFGRN